MIIYVDTSAAAKLVVEEAGSDALAARLEELRRSDVLVSSFLLHTELYRAAARRDEIAVDDVAAVLSTIDLIDIERADLLTAAALPGRLRSADAIHLATAIRTHAGRMVVYDEELRRAAATSGLHTEAPGTAGST